MTEESYSEEFHDMDRIPEKFLYSIGCYYGEFTPENLVFNVNLHTMRLKSSGISLSNLKKNF